MSQGFTQPPGERLVLPLADFQAGNQVSVEAPKTVVLVALQAVSLGVHRMARSAVQLAGLPRPEQRQTHRAFRRQRLQKAQRRGAHRGEKSWWAPSIGTH